MLILTGQAVHWVRYEAEVGEKEFEYSLTRRDGRLFTADGEEYDGEGEVTSEEGGS